MRNRYVLLADLPLVTIAAFGAFALRFDWQFLRHRPEFLAFLAGVLILKPVVFYLFGMYGRYWRYASAQDLIAVTLAASAASVIVATYVLLGSSVGIIGEFSRQVIAIDWLLTLAMTGGLRMSIRVVGDAREKAQKGSGSGGQKRVLVVGAGEAGTLVVREMQKNPQLNLQPVGFLDDAAHKHGKWIHGIRVLGGLDSLASVLKSEAIDEVLVAMPTAPGRVVRAVSESCRQAGLTSRTLPGVFELLDGKVSVSRLRQVEIADLLRRSQVVSSPGVSSYIAGRTVLVTGAGGSIGSELCRQVAHAHPQCLVLLGHGENSIFETAGDLGHAFPLVHLSTVIADIRDAARLAQVFDRVRPHLVFHAAAHKHVPLMEENPEEAVTNNIIGTRNVVNQAIRTGTERLVLISTDKAVSPTNIMGASKRVAEAIVRDAAQRSGRAFVVVRFGNVLGSRGSVVNIFKKQIEQGGPITVTHPDMARYFMTIPEAVHLVLQASGKGKGGELFVLDMGQPVRIVDLAQDLIRLSGLSQEDVRVVFTGIRPGEKLEETLIEAGAETHQTCHPEILEIVSPERCVGPDLAHVVSRIEEAAVRGDRAGLEVLLKETFPALTSAAASPVVPASRVASVH